MIQPSVALVCSGPVSRTPLSRLPGLHSHLALVKAASFRLASRIVNALKAGKPVREYSEIRDCPVVLLHFLKEDRERALFELSKAILWRDRIAVLYDSGLGCEVLQPLRSKGARVATLDNVGGLGREQFIVEGDTPVAREICGLLLQRRTGILEIPRGKKRAYLRSVYLATQVFPSLVAEISESLRSTLPKTESDRLTALMLTEMMSAYFRGGRRSVPLNVDWESVAPRTSTLLRR